MLRAAGRVGRGSRSAASTSATSTAFSPPAPPVWSSYAQSPRRQTRAPPLPSSDSGWMRLPRRTSDPGAVRLVTGQWQAWRPDNPLRRTDSGCSTRRSAIGCSRRRRLAGSSTPTVRCRRSRRSTTRWTAIASSFAPHLSRGWRSVLSTKLWPSRSTASMPRFAPAGASL